MSSSKFVKLNEKTKNSVIKPNINCFDFTRCPTPDLKQLDNFLFVEYAGQRHIHPQRVSSAKLQDVSSLKITYFTSDHVSCLQQTSNNLQKLDLSNSNLFKLPIGIINNMHQLQVFILDFNQLTESSFCKEFGNILGNSLKELSICSNLLTLLPDILDNLHKLTRLKLTNNSISTLKGIDKLKRLKILNIDNNQLTQLGNGFYQIKRLEHAYVSHNQITSISVTIKHMNYLKEIDLSYNNLKSIPPEIFQLQNLEILKLNDNKIIKLPKFKITGKSKKKLILVDLSSNNIVRFPDCVMKVTEELDLSNNKIKNISPNIIKKIPYTTTQKLNISNNPLCNPPKEICESGLKCMIQFYQESETITKSNYGLKIFCFGSENINKLNIISSLIDQNEDSDVMMEKENILEIFDTTFELTNDKNITENSMLNLQFIDIFGENNETYWLTLFITCPALEIIFVDVDNYTKESFIDIIGIWLQQVILKQNEITFMLVGITKNKIDDNQEIILNSIKSDITEFFNNYVDKIIDEIYKIESQTKINASMSLSLKKFIQFKSIKMVLHEQCCLINSTNIKSISKLRKEIIIMATKMNVFEKVMSPIPSFWSDVQLYFEEESYKFPIMSVNEYESLIQQQFNLKPAAIKIANFLHETGYFLWWENSPSPLNKWIITCPFSLVECVRVLFRADLKTYLEDPIDPDRICKRYKKKFYKSHYTYKECCNILFNKSILLPELATILWENILPVKYISLILYYLCECWSLGYLINYPKYTITGWMLLNKEINENYTETLSSIDSVEYRAKSAESTKSNKSNTSSQNKLPPVFFPWFITKTKCSEEANEKWLLNKSYRICAHYKFSLGLPKIISEQLLVKANNKEKFQSNRIDHWIGGTQCEIENTNILFRVYRNEFVDKEHFLKYEFRYFYDSDDIDIRSNIAKSYSTLIWQVLLPFLTDVDDFLDSYKGLWYERLIECPHCEQASFLGMWNAYSDSPSYEDKLCQLCGLFVPLHVLDPPKLNTNVSPEEVIKNIRRQYDRL